MKDFEFKAHLDKALLPSDSRIRDSIEDENLPNNGDYCKATTLILVVLFVCGILAFGISVVVWHFYDIENDVWVPHTSTMETIGIVVVLLLCGILALGLPAAVWRYYEKLESEPNSPRIGSQFPTADPVVAHIANSAPPVYEKRIIGYYTEFESRDITKQQLSKLTHAVFAYVEMTVTGGLQFRNDNSKNRFLILRKKAKSCGSDVKVMISIGGYENSQHFASVTADSEKKSVFINSIDSFLREHKIDGVDFYWKDATGDDKGNYIAFIRELHEKLNDKKHYLISLTIPPPSISNWEFAYDLEESLEDVDFFNVYSMDYQGPWDNQWGTPAGPIAALYSTTEGRKQFSVDATMKFYVCKTKKPSKFNIVIPFFARLWRHVKGPLEHGKEVIRDAELRDNKAVGNAYMSRWTVNDQKFNLTPATWDEETKSSYIFDSQRKTYLTFEDEKSIAAKVDYVNRMNLGGVWIWTVEMDDDQNSLLDLVSTKQLCSTKSGINVNHQC